MNRLLADRFLRNIASRWMIFAIEQFLAAFAAMLTVLVIFRIGFLTLEWGDILWFVGLNALVSALSMLVNRTHHGLIRYSELRDLYTVVKFSVLQFMVWMVIAPFFTPSLGIGLAFQVAGLLINMVLGFVMLVSFRLLVKEVYTRTVRSLHDKQNVLIYGAGDIGLATKKAMEFDKKSNARVVGFLDDSPDKIGKVLNGKRILSADPAFLRGYLPRQQVRQVILTVDIDPEQKAALSQVCFEAGVSITTIPPLSQWIRGIFNRRQLKELSIESLLGRDRIELLDKEARKDLEGKVVLVTGAAGSIGSDICRQLCRYRLEQLILLDQSETGLHDISLELSRLEVPFEIRMELASVRDEQRIRRLISLHRPSYIFHAAAYKHVPILEEFPAEVALTNVVGTRILADAALEYGVGKFVMISSDKAVNPTNLMGACKRIGEIYVQALSPDSRTQFITTRFGNVLGSNGSVVPLFKQQIDRGGPVTITHPEITRYFMTIPEASSLVLEAAVMGRGGEIFVFDMGRPVRIADLAVKMIQLAGLRPEKDIPIVYSGLRPGEKMFEELFTCTENLLPTHHPKIMKAQRSEVTADFHELLDELVAESHQHNNKAVKALIRRLVPEYKHTHAIQSTAVSVLRPAVPEAESAATPPLANPLMRVADDKA